jgi:hypothetical protein
MEGVMSLGRGSTRRWVLWFIDCKVSRLGMGSFCLSLRVYFFDCFRSSYATAFALGTIISFHLQVVQGPLEGREGILPFPLPGERPEFISPLLPSHLSYLPSLSAI